jgi:hypothetical protein
MTIKENFINTLCDWIDKDYNRKHVAEQLEVIAEEFAIKFGRWVIQNQELENTSSWSEETANYYLNVFKEENKL